MNQLNSDVSNNDYNPPSFSPPPTFHPCLPPICETTEFGPILDPLGEQPFHDVPSLMSKTNINPGSQDNERPPTRSRIRRRPIQPAQQLESELWAARLGFCSE